MSLSDLSDHEMMSNFETGWGLSNGKIVTGLCRLCCLYPIAIQIDLLTFSVWGALILGPKNTECQWVFGCIWMSRVML